METIGLIFGIIGAIASIYTILDYRKNHVEKPNEEKKNLLIQFRSNQRLSQELKGQLQDYAAANLAYHEHIYPGITYSEYIKALEDSLNTNLSDELYERTAKLELTTSNIQSMLKSLEAQFNALIEVQGYHKLKHPTM